METWEELEKRHGQELKAYIIQRDKHRQEVRDFHGNNLPVSVMDKVMLQERDYEEGMMARHFEEARKHPQLPEYLKEFKPLASPPEPDSKHPTVLKKPLSLDDYYAAQKIQQIQNLQETEKLWHDRLNRQLIAEAQQRHSEETARLKTINPLENTTDVFEQLLQAQRAKSQAIDQKLQEEKDEDIFVQLKRKQQEQDQNQNGPGDDR